MTLDPNLIIMSLGLAEQVFSASKNKDASKAQIAGTLQSSELAAQGSLLQAAGFRQTAQSLQGTTSFNLEVDKTNLQRRLKSTSRQFQRLIGKQTVQAAGTGLAISSKSFLALRNEASTEFSRELLNLKLDAENARRGKIFESSVKASQLENQARAAEFQAGLQRSQGASRSSEIAFQSRIASLKTATSVAKGLPSILSAARGTS